jgi:hypothetical protein
VISIKLFITLGQIAMVMGTNLGGTYGGCIPKRIQKPNTEGHVHGKSHFNIQFIYYFILEYVLERFKTIPMSRSPDGDDPIDVNTPAIECSWSNWGGPRFRQAMHFFGLSFDRLYPAMIPRPRQVIDLTGFVAYC